MGFFIVILAVAALFYIFPKLIVQAITKNRILAAKVGFWIGLIMAVLISPLSVINGGDSRAEMFQILLDNWLYTLLIIGLTILIVGWGLRTLVKRETGLNWPWDKEIQS